MHKFNRSVMAPHLVYIDYYKSFLPNEEPERKMKEEITGMKRKVHLKPLLPNFNKTSKICNKINQERVIIYYYNKNQEEKMLSYLNSPLVGSFKGKKKKKRAQSLNELDDLNEIINPLIINRFSTQKNRNDKKNFLLRKHIHFSKENNRNNNDDSNADEDQIERRYIKPLLNVRDVIINRHANAQNNALKEKKVRAYQLKKSLMLLKKDKQEAIAKRVKEQVNKELITTKKLVLNPLYQIDIK